MRCVSNKKNHSYRGLTCFINNTVLVQRMSFKYRTLSRDENTERTWNWKESFLSAWCFWFWQKFEQFLRQKPSHHSMISQFHGYQTIKTVKAHCSFTFCVVCISGHGEYWRWLIFQIDFERLEFCSHLSILCHWNSVIDRSFFVCWHWICSRL